MLEAFGVFSLTAVREAGILHGAIHEQPFGL